MIEGNFKDVSLPGLLQFLGAEVSKNYRVRVSSNTQAGEIYVCRGFVVCAGFGLLEGEDALCEFLSWRDGQFFVETLTAQVEVKKNLKRAIQPGNAFVENCALLSANNVGLNTVIVASKSFGTVEWQESLRQQPLEREDFVVLGWVGEGRTMRQALREFGFDIAQATAILCRLLQTNSVQVMRPVTGETDVPDGVEPAVAQADPVVQRFVSTGGQSEAAASVAQAAARAYAQEATAAVAQDAFISTSFKPTSMPQSEAKPEKPGNPLLNPIKKIGLDLAQVRASMEARLRSRGSTRRSGSDHPAVQPPPAAPQPQAGSTSGNFTAMGVNYPNPSSSAPTNYGSANYGGSAGGAFGASTSNFGGAGGSFGPVTGSGASMPVVPSSTDNGAASPEGSAPSQAVQDFQDEAAASNQEVLPEPVVPTQSKTAMTAAEILAQIQQELKDTPEESHAAASAFAELLEPTAPQTVSSDSHMDDLDDLLPADVGARLKEIAPDSEPFVLQIDDDVTAAETPPPAAPSTQSVPATVAESSAPAQPAAPSPQSAPAAPAAPAPSKLAALVPPNGTGSGPKSAPSAGPIALPMPPPKPAAPAAPKTAPAQPAQAQKPAASTAMPPKAASQPAAAASVVGKAPSRTEALPMVTIDIDRLLQAIFVPTQFGKLALTNPALDQFRRQTLLDVEAGKSLLDVIGEENRPPAAILSSYRYCLDRGYIESGDPVVPLTADLLLGRMEIDQYLLQRRRLTGDQLRDLVDISRKEGVKLTQILVRSGYLTSSDLATLDREQKRFAFK